MKYIEVHNTTEAYRYNINHTEYFPHVDYTLDTKIPHFDPERPRGNYLKFTALEDSTIALECFGNNTPYFQISYDNGASFEDWDYASVTVPKGSVVCINGFNPNGVSLSATVYSKLSITGLMSVEGELSNLIDSQASVNEYCSFCFYRFFKGCAITTAPSISVPTIGSYALAECFMGCAQLIEPPTLGATFLNTHSYHSMFEGCESLLYCPKLPAIQTKEYMYCRMFAGCTSLERTCTLPALHLLNHSYEEMFSGCTKLHEITVKATSKEDGSTLNWAAGVAASGTLFCAEGQESLWPTDNPSGCPVGWRLVSHYYLEWVNNTSNDDVTITWQKNLVTSVLPTLYTSSDLVTWTLWDPTTALTVSTNLYMRGVNSSFDGRFVTSAALDLKGHFSALVDYRIDNPALSEYCFKGLFQNCSMGNCKDALLNFSVLPKGCYSSMFNHSTITHAPTFATLTFIGENSCTSMFEACSSLLEFNYLDAELGHIGPALSAYCFSTMFISCIKLATIPSTLNFSSIGAHACEGMFCACNSLVNAPTLPCVVLGDSCYKGMFLNCDKLKSAPYLPSSTLPDSCYEQMFQNCFALETAPTFPLTNLQMKSNCCQRMLRGCSGLIECVVPVCSYIPDGAMNEFCYNCTSLVSATSSIAVLTNYAGSSAFKSAFYNCSLLAVAPSLTVTEVGTNCFDSTFYNCRVLQTPPTMLTHSVSDHSFYRTFYECRQLQSAAQFPAELTKPYCYAECYKNCVALTNPTTLASAVVDEASYQSMFEGCTSLTHATVLATDVTTNSNAIKDMFLNCKNVDTGVLTISQGMDDKWGNESLKGAVPELWSKKSEFFRVDPGSASVTFSPTNTDYVFQYSTDQLHWYTSTTPITIYSPTYIAGVTGVPCVSSATRGCFISDAIFTCAGALNCLIGETTSNALPNYAFFRLFYNAKLASCLDMNVASIPALSEYCFSRMFEGCTNIGASFPLPHTELARGCYYYMFYNSNISTAPTLPAQVCAPFCYGYMFYNSKLTDPPELPATTLADHCYYGMFMSCANLTSVNTFTILDLTGAPHCYGSMYAGTPITTAPVLPATTLSTSCYWNMFCNCRKLNLPQDYILPAQSLPEACYEYMFQYCSSLTMPPVIQASSIGNWSCAYMFDGCSGLSTYVPSLNATTLGKSCYKYMFQNCTKITAAPDLPAPTLQKECYAYMFKGCTSLISLTCKATNISATDCMTNWLSGVNTSGTFYFDNDPGFTKRSSSGIPTKWSYPWSFEWVGFPTTFSLSIYSTTDDSLLAAYPATSGTHVYAAGAKVDSSLTSRYSLVMDAKHSKVVTTALNTLEDWTVEWSGVPAGSLPILTDSVGNTCQYPSTSYKVLNYDRPTSATVSSISYYDSSVTIDATKHKFKVAYEAQDVEWTVSWTDYTSGGIKPKITFSNGCTVTRPTTSFTCKYNDSPIWATYSTHNGYTVGCRIEKENLKVYAYIYDASEGLMFYPYHSSSIKIHGSVLVTSGKSYSYRLMGDSWADITGDIETVSPVLIKVKDSALSFSSDKVTGYFGISGNISKVVYSGATCEAMFQSNAALKCCDGLIINANPTANSFYKNMFYSCSSLSGTPKFTFTTFNSHSNVCESMFRNTSVSELPELPVTVLADYCYYDMYASSKIKTVDLSKLKATTLANYCYYYMFNAATQISKVTGTLSASLTTGCYYGMFRSCSGITSVNTNMLPQSPTVTNCYKSMFYGCSKLVTLPTVNGSDASGSTACWSMFRDCSSATTAKCAFSKVSGTIAHWHMYQGCSKLEKLYCKSTSLWGSNYQDGGVRNECQKILY